MNDERIVEILDMLAKNIPREEQKLEAYRLEAVSLSDKCERRVGELKSIINDLRMDLTAKIGKVDKNVAFNAATMAQLTGGHGVWAALEVEIQSRKKLSERVVILAWFVAIGVGIVLTLQFVAGVA